MLAFTIANRYGTRFKKLASKRLVYVTNYVKQMILEMFVDCRYSNKVAVAILLCRLVAVANSGAHFSK